MIDVTTEQRSLDWFRARLGHATGSKISDIMTASRKKDEVFGDTAKTYLKTLAFERTLNQEVVNDDQAFQDYLDEVNVTSKAMRIGTEREDEAVNCFKDVFEEQYEITEVSSCKHDTIPFFAASPDRILRDKQTGEIGILEVKCPTGGVHIGYLAEIKNAASLKAVKKEYYWQMMAEMSCTGAKYGVFLSYNPWSKYPAHVVYIERNEEDIKQLEERVVLANQFIEEYIKK
jgi:hypothetical protein